MVDLATHVIYLVDQGSATRSDVSHPFAGTVHYSSQNVLHQLATVGRQAISYIAADDLESLVCSAFCFKNSYAQAKLEGMHKSLPSQVQELWQQTWQPKPWWQEAIHATRQTNYTSVSGLLSGLLQ